MSLLITLLLALSAHGNELVEIDKVTPVYAKPELDARVLFNLRPRETVETFKSKVPEYLQIKVIRKGRAYQGFVFRSDVMEIELPEEERSRGVYGFGGGAMYTSLTQNGKSFYTDDSVQYSTSTYKSALANPYIVAQQKWEDFWRVSISYKQTHFTAAATTNVGASAQEIDLKHTFVSILLQRAWTPFDFKELYFGAGAELAKATAVEIKLGSRTLSTSQMDLPIYLGAVGFVGYAVEVNRWISFYVEGRYEYVANQAPAVSGVEGALGVLYWP